MSKVEFLFFLHLVFHSRWVLWCSFVLIALYWFGWLLTFRNWFSVLSVYHCRDIVEFLFSSSLKIPLYSLLTNCLLISFEFKNNAWILKRYNFHTLSVVIGNELVLLMVHVNINARAYCYQTACRMCQVIANDDFSWLETTAYSQICLAFFLRKIAKFIDKWFSLEQNEFRLFSFRGVFVANIVSLSHSLGVCVCVCLWVPSSLFIYSKEPFRICFLFLF